MNDYQRQEAIDLLCIVTDVNEDAIEAYEDYALEAWLGELGYEWRENDGMFGAWKPFIEVPAFAPVPVHVECDDFGPLFEVPA